MPEPYYQLKLATEITIAAIQNGLQVNPDNITMFFDKVCSTIEQHRLDWEKSLETVIVTHDADRDS
ncbi:MAG: hypothetical protein IJT21_10125 [Synergistaceae bacterium]|nr:hypothetical protein [Synergistaceae bacterium]